MLTVIDFLSDSGSLLPSHMVKVKYQINDDTHILSWLGLITSIPLAWKTKIKHHFSDSQHIGTDSMRRNTVCPNLSVKQVYRALVKPLINPPTAQKSLEQYLGKSEIDWEEVYLTPLEITIESQLRVFQYKILNNVLYLSNRLFKMGYAESPLCSLCKRENETVSHLFCNCIFTQQLWKKLQVWVTGYLILPASEPSIVILGVWNIKNENNLLVNHVVLLFKYFIYKNRTNRHAINIHALKNYIKFLQKIEQRIARKKIDWKNTLQSGSQLHNSSIPNEQKVVN